MGCVVILYDNGLEGRSAEESMGLLHGKSDNEAWAMAQAIEERHIKQQKFLHFAFAKNKRLGENSPVRMLVDDLVGVVYEFLMDGPACPK